MHLEWLNPAKEPVPLDEAVVFIRKGGHEIESGLSTANGLVTADALGTGNPPIPFREVGCFAPARKMLSPEMMEDVIDSLYPPEDEERLAREIAQEVVKSPAFENLVEIRRMYPHIVTPAKQIAIWILGIQRQDYNAPFSVSADPEDILCAHYVDVPEYAAFAGCETDDPYETMLHVSRSRKGLGCYADQVLDPACSRRLDELFSELEDIGRRKIAECIRLSKARA